MTTQTLARWPLALDVAMDEPSDLELAKQTKGGNAEAYSTLVRRHQRVVYNLAYRFLRDAHLAEDMAQEAFIKGFRMLHGFRGDSRFSTWMYRVTCTVCLRELKRRKRRAAKEAITKAPAAQAALYQPAESPEV